MGRFDGSIKDDSNSSSCSANIVKIIQYLNNQQLHVKYKNGSQGIEQVKDVKRAKPQMYEEFYDLHYHDFVLSRKK